MATVPGFQFSHQVEDVMARMPLGTLDPSVEKQLTEVVSMLVDRDRDVEDFLTFTLAGQKDKTTITATAGGATITFGRPFTRTPIITVANPCDSGGYTACLVDASISTTSFKVQIFTHAGVEVVAGLYKVPWIAA